MSRRELTAQSAGRTESVLSQMEQHLRCLYVHDAVGRIHSIREPASPRPPRFHLGRTRLGNLWRFRDDLPSSLVRDLSRLVGREPGLAPGWPAHGRHPPERIEALRRLLREHGGIADEWRGPAYRFPEPRGHDDASRDSRDDAREAPDVLPVGPRDGGLLERHFPDALAELALRQPCVALVVSGDAVSLCCCARLPATGGKDARDARCGVEARVETAPGHRGCGFGSRTAAAWARLVRELGLEPLYSTSWENRASQALARRLGLIAYGEDLHVT
jgi:GNAT superfamily N-acetyltransferase